MMATGNRWRQARVKVNWEDASIGFDCPCGAIDWVMTSESERDTCDFCGRTYRFVVRLEVREPTANGEASGARA